ncbi:HAD family hydrolase [bacterium]|nr:HAD family hydrolase [bacterium]
MRFAAVIFDLDGTLLNSLADIAAAANRVLQERHLPDHAVDAYRMFVGNGVRELMRRALPRERRTEALVSDLEKRFRDVYAESWDIRTAPYPGIPEMLAALAERDIPMAVCSNKPHDFTLRCVDRFFPETPFRAVHGKKETVPAKPNPISALALAMAMDTDPSCTMFVGDSGVDMETALRAGMFPAGVAWGFRDESELRKAGAEIIIEHPDQIAQLW